MAVKGARLIARIRMPKSPSSCGWRGSAEPDRHHPGCWFVQHMDADQRNIYLNKGIAPVVNHARSWQALQRFQQQRSERGTARGPRDAYSGNAAWSSCWRP